VTESVAIGLGGTERHQEMVAGVEMEELAV